MAIVSKKKMRNGNYRVTINGRETMLLIAEGRPPIHMEPQLWRIGRQLSYKSDDVEWMAGGLRSLDGTLAMVRVIVSEAHAAIEPTKAGAPTS